MDILFLKQKAKEQIRGSMPMLCLYFFIFAVCSALLILIHKYIGTAAVVLLILPVFSLSFAKICLAFTENKKPSLSIIKDGMFRFSRTMITVILLIAYTIGWTHVYILPVWAVDTLPYYLKFGFIFEGTAGGILRNFIYVCTIIFMIVSVFIKLLSYPMTFFVLSENIYVDSDESIIRSKTIMKGHKKEFFRLFLSFSGWFLLMIATAGIASVWVLPYYCTTVANYYHEIKGNFTSEVYIKEKY